MTVAYQLCGSFQSS